MDNIIPTPVFGKKEQAELARKNDAWYKEAKAIVQEVMGNEKQFADELTAFYDRPENHEQHEEFVSMAAIVDAIGHIFTTHLNEEDKYILTMALAGRLVVKRQIMRDRERTVNKLLAEGWKPPTKKKGK